MRDVDRLVAAEVTKSYASASGARMQALDGVTVELCSGRSVGIIGESGSGKSTLARLLLGLSSASSGHVTFNGREMQDILMSSRLKAEFRRTVQFIGQDTSSSFDPLRTLRDSVRTPLRQLCGLSRAGADSRVDEVLGKLSLPLNLADRYPRDVSGGQRQRFAIARANRPTGVWKDVARGVPLRSRDRSREVPSLKRGWTTGSPDQVARRRCARAKMIKKCDGPSACMLSSRLDSRHWQPFTATSARRHSQLQTGRSCRRRLR